jgi:predicted flap endonuclease-1-like 5' DNA nuclease
VPYTLAKYLGWLIPAVLLGGVFGWLFARRSSSTTTTATAATMPTAEVAEVDRLRARVANLEAAVAERDRLRVALDECRQMSRKQAERADSATAALQAAEAAAADAKAAALHAGPAAGVQGFAALTDVAADPEPAAAADVAPPMPDLTAAASVLGRKIQPNDLKVVEGIGPKIEELCHGKGILTWWDLSRTAPAALAAMLNEAGPRFQMHDPSTWPEQGRLLATGAFEEFKALTDRLSGGRAAD